MSWSAISPPPSGTTMSPALSAFLCLGLCLGHRMRAQADNLPRPSLRAENGSLVPLGRRVTFRCRGSPGAAEYFLAKEQGSGYQRIGSELSQEYEAEFSIPSMTMHHAGTYSCSYRRDSYWSEPSEPLELVATGVYRSPSLSAWPNSTVAPGQDVTLQCHSQLSHNRSALYKDGEQVTQAPAQPHAWGSQANFSIPAVNSTHGGTYRCYSFQSRFPHQWSAPSDPLELRVTDKPPRPSLSTENGSLGPLGRSVTLRCRGSPGATEYLLEQELEYGFQQRDSKLSQEDEVEFFIPWMTPNHAGTYSCSYKTASLWSEPSEPLELVITGMYLSPSLSVWPNSMVAPGQTMILQCHSEVFYDRFALYKDGAQIIQITTAQFQPPEFLANFPILAVNSTHGGTYRCYSFQSLSPHQWSSPSNPLELRVTGPAAQDYRVGNIIRLGLAGLVLVLLGLLLAEAWNGCRGGPGGAPASSDRGEGGAGRH